jgi:ABC-type antimicrobial peptide transport system permease subunit
MLRNFFTVAFRNLFKHKVFSFINIFGVALGIAASLLIVQYARVELSYDRFEPHAGQIYRLQLDRYNNGKLSTFGLFAGLAIFVSCMGLLGLAAFVTSQRTKEIGIRKIVGASLSRILLLLTRDFMKPLVIAFLLAIPLTWWLLRQWLDNFAFRMHIDAWIFILPILLVLLIALLAVSSQTLRAASANPANSLRSE